MSEVDLECTYVGGSAELIASLLRDPGLEALPAKLIDLTHYHMRSRYQKSLDEMATVLSTRGSAELATPIGRLGARLEGDGQAERVRVKWSRADGAHVGELAAKIGNSGPRAHRGYLMLGLEKLVRG
ncbi:MAG: hypothetical protein WBA31_06000 [Candidatus Dormiibacterota bacterium]